MNYQKLFLFVFLIIHPYQSFSGYNDNVKFIISGLLGGICGGGLVIWASNSGPNSKKLDMKTIQSNIEEFKYEFAVCADRLQSMVQKVGSTPVLSGEILQRYDEISHKKLIAELEEQKHLFFNLLQQKSNVLQNIKKDLNSLRNNANEDWFVRAESFIKEAEASLQKNEINKEKFVLVLALHRNFDQFVQAHHAINDISAYRFFDIIFRVKNREKFDRNFILGVYPTSSYPMVQAVDKIHEYRINVQQKLNNWSLADHKETLAQMDKEDREISAYIANMQANLELLKNTLKQISQLPGYENEVTQHAQWQQSLEEARGKQQIELQKAEAAKLHEQKELTRLNNEKKEQADKHERRKLKQIELTKRAEAEKIKAKANNEAAKFAAEQASFQANAARYAKEQDEIALKKIELEKKVQEARDESHKELSYIKGLIQRLSEKVVRLEECNSPVGAGMPPKNGKMDGGAGMQSSNERGAGRE